MSGIILHHFDISPFAEKIRLAIGLKQLAWQSVEIPLVMPKPDLTALTGGYRKTPVMQIGADIYCDTQRIARELEQRFPDPPLFPDGSEGLCLALGPWADGAFFQPGSGLSMATNEGLPEDILRDRGEFFSYLDMETLQADVPHFFSQYLAHVGLVASMTRGRTDYLLGAAPSWADILAYFPLWMGRANIAGVAARLDAMPELCAWEERVRQLGHGRREETSAADAHAVARASTSSCEPGVTADAHPDLTVGSPVLVTPVDYGAVPVAGTLVRLTPMDIAIGRTDPLTGPVVVHFPRLGYRVSMG